MTTHPDREPIAHVDHAWLRMDSPTNQMVITALLIFEEPPGFEAIKAFVRDRLLLEKRFRQRVAPSRVPLAPPHWELDPALDLATHVHHVALPDPGGDLELQAFISDLVGTPLPEGRPLWQVHYVEGFGRGAAVVARVHHALGDGVSMVRMLLGISDARTGAAAAEVGVETPRASGAAELAKQVASQTATLGRLLFLSADPKTPLKGTLGRRKHAVYSHSYELERVKRAAHRLGAKTNDLLMAGLTAALREHLLERHCDVADLEIRAMVPVYVKPARRSDELGNHFGLVFVSLPLGISDSLERVKELQRRMDVIKAAPDAVVALEVLAAIGVASSEIEHIAIELFTRKASVMVTNIPGPHDRIQIAGKPVSSMVVWAPVSGHLGMGISLMSYAGQMRLAVATDAGLVSEPEALVAAFERELDGLIGDQPSSTDSTGRRGVADASSGA